MLRTKSARRNFGLAAMLVLSLIGWFVSAKIVRVADAASYTGVAKPMEFYFHYVDAPVDVAGTQSKYVMNTTRLFKFATNQEALTNSFYKPSGLPKLTVYFYLYPNVAGQAIFKLPKGTYDIEAHFSAEYWLRVVTTSQALQGVSVNSSMSKTIVLSEFPPQIWTTTAFWLIAALIAVSVLVAVYVVFLSKRASTPRRPALRRRT